MRGQHGTHLFYNGVLLQDCELHEFSQSIEVDEGGSDLVYSRFQISVSSTIVSQRDNHHPSTVRAKNDRAYAADQLRELEHKLNQTRKDFWIATHSATGNIVDSPTIDSASDDDFRLLLVAVGETSEEVRKNGNTHLQGRVDGLYDYLNVSRDEVIDSKGGPTPISVSVQRIFGGRAIRVAFTIEVCRLVKMVDDDGSVSPKTPPTTGAVKSKHILSHKWSIVSSIRADWKRTWSVSGTAIVEDHRYKPMIKAVLNGGFFLPPYARVESVRNEVDKTGLKMQYEYEFAQEGDAPPQGVAEWSGTYTESQGIAANQTVGAMSVRVKGSIVPASDSEKQKAMLLRVGFAIILSRISGLKRTWKKQPGQNPQSVILKEGVVVETLGKPELEIRATVMYTSQEAAAGAIINEYNLRLGNLGKPLQIKDYDPRWWPNLWRSARTGFAASEQRVSDLEEEARSFYEGTERQNPSDDWNGWNIAWLERDPPLDDDNDKRFTVDPPNRDYVFEAYEVTTLENETKYCDTLIQPAQQYGINAETALSGFTYLQWESDVRYDTTAGKIHLPLSKPRTLSAGTNAPPKIETAVVCRAHAPLCRRVYKVIATREGAYPKLPFPLESIEDSNGYQETLLSARLLTPTPYLQSDNITMTYGIQAEWTYALSRPPGFGSSGSSTSESFAAGSSPIDSTTPQDNRLPIRQAFDMEGKLYNEQRASWG